jgi:hypothetical protein
MAEEWENIRKALENPQYKWRTVEGIAKETGYDFSKVIDTLKANESQVLKSSLPATDGRDLFTTRERYRKTSTIWERLESAITNKV